MRVAVVGSGPNGLAAAISLAEAGCTVHVFGAAAAAGGSTRSGERYASRFLPPLAGSACILGAPRSNQAATEVRPQRWIHPNAPFTASLDDGTAVMLEASIEKTAEGLGSDRQRYIDLFAPFVDSWPKIHAMTCWRHHSTNACASLACRVRFGVLAMPTSTWRCRLRFKDRELGHSSPSPDCLWFLSLHFQTLPSVGAGDRFHTYGRGGHSQRRLQRISESTRFTSIPLRRRRPMNHPTTNLQALPSRQ